MEVGKVRGIPGLWGLMDGIGRGLKVFICFEGLSSMVRLDLGRGEGGKVGLEGGDRPCLP